MSAPDGRGRLREIGERGKRVRRSKENFGQSAVGNAEQGATENVKLSGDSVEKSAGANSPSSAPKEDGRRGIRRAKEILDWEADLQSLLELGERLDLPTTIERQWRPGPKDGEFSIPTCRDAWIEDNLKIRTKKGGRTSFRLNSVQRAYSQTCGKQNIVLKARQLGITSYIAARLFAQTVTRKGTLTMLVAHDRLAAEEIFRIVQPGRMRLAEDRITMLERHDIRRNLLDRMVTAAIAFAVSALIALHDHLLPR
jgi:hypothetical protein